MGEKESEPFQFTFNGFLKVAFQGSRVTSDAGLVLVRELDERLGLEAILTEHLRDSRHGPPLSVAGSAQSHAARPVQSFHYQADSWTTPRRVMAKVEHHVGELFPRVGFIVTNLQVPNRAVVRFYNKRGTAEQWIKEGKQAAHWTRLSCHSFRANEVRLQLSVLAYNLGNLWRRLVLPARIDTWSLTSLQQRLVKTGGRLVKHARYYWLLLAESHLTRRLFGSMLQRIWALPVPTG